MSCSPSACIRQHTCTTLSRCLVVVLNQTPDMLHNVSLNLSLVWPRCNPNPKSTCVGRACTLVKSNTMIFACIECRALVLGCEIGGIWAPTPEITTQCTHAEAYPSDSWRVPGLRRPDHFAVHSGLSHHGQRHHEFQSTTVSCGAYFQVLHPHLAAPSLLFISLPIPQSRCTRTQGVTTSAKGHRDSSSAQYLCARSHLPSHAPSSPLYLLLFLSCHPHN